MSLFIELGEKKNKVFIPSDYDQKILDGIVRMMVNNNDEEILEECVKKYISSCKDVVFSVNDFANRLTGIYKEASEARRSRMEMSRLLAETKKRMEQE